MIFPSMTQCIKHRTTQIHIHGLHTFTLEEPPGALAFLGSGLDSTALETVSSTGALRKKVYILNINS